MFRIHELNELNLNHKEMILDKEILRIVAQICINFCRHCFTCEESEWRCTEDILDVSVCLGEVDKIKEQSSRKRKPSTMLWLSGECSDNHFPHDCFINKWMLSWSLHYFIDSESLDRIYCGYGWLLLSDAWNLQGWVEIIRHFHSCRW